MVTTKTGNKGTRYTFFANGGLDQSNPSGIGLRYLEFSWHSIPISAKNPCLTTLKRARISNRPRRVPIRRARRNDTQMAKIKPLGDKVVVQVLEADDKTAGGIILPDSAKKKPTEGKVIAVGDGRVLDNGDRNKLSVKKGDRVLFSKYGGNEVTLDGQDYTILDEDQIYAILN